MIFGKIYNSNLVWNDTIRFLGSNSNQFGRDMTCHGAIYLEIGFVKIDQVLKEAYQFGCKAKIWYTNYVCASKSFQMLFGCISNAIWMLFIGIPNAIRMLFRCITDESRTLNNRGDPLKNIDDYHENNQNQQ